MIYIENPVNLKYLASDFLRFLDVGIHFGQPCQKNTNHICGWCFFIAGIGIRTHFNARLRWSLARFRLDGIDTMIESNPSSSAADSCIFCKKRYNICIITDMQNMPNVFFEALKKVAHFDATLTAFDLKGRRTMCPYYLRRRNANVL